MSASRAAVGCGLGLHGCLTHTHRCAYDRVAKVCINLAFSLGHADEASALLREAIAIARRGERGIGRSECVVAAVQAPTTAVATRLSLGVGCCCAGPHRHAAHRYVRAAVRLARLCLAKDQLEEAAKWVEAAQAGMDAADVSEDDATRASVLQLRGDITLAGATSPEAERHGLELLARGANMLARCCGPDHPLHANALKALGEVRRLHCTAIGGGSGGGGGLAARVRAPHVSDKRVALVT